MVEGRLSRQRGPHRCTPSSTRAGRGGRRMMHKAVTLTVCGKPASPPSHRPWKTSEVFHSLTASTTTNFCLTPYRGTHSHPFHRTASRPSDSIPRCFRPPKRVDDEKLVPEPGVALTDSCDTWPWPRGSQVWREPDRRGRVDGHRATRRWRREALRGRLGGGQRQPGPLYSVRILSSFLSI